MTSLEQALQMLNLDRSALDEIHPNLADILSDVASGHSNRRRSILTQGRAANHWQWGIVNDFTFDEAWLSANFPNPIDIKRQWRSEIADTLTYALYLQDNHPWKLAAEQETVSGTVCVFERYDETGTVRARVGFSKCIALFNTRTLPVHETEYEELL